MPRLRSFVISSPVGEPWASVLSAALTARTSLRQVSVLANLALDASCLLLLSRLERLDIVHISPSGGAHPGNFRDTPPLALQLSVYRCSQMLQLRLAALCNGQRLPRLCNLCLSNVTQTSTAALAGAGGPIACQSRRHPRNRRLHARAVVPSLRSAPSGDCLGHRRQSGRRRWQQHCRSAPAWAGSTSATPWTLSPQQCSRWPQCCERAPCCSACW